MGRSKTINKMKPTITFDKSASEFILKAFDKNVDFLGHIKNSEGKIEKCGICKKDLSIKNFAGIMKEIGLVCDSIFCLGTVSDKIGKMIPK